MNYKHIDKLLAKLLIITTKHDFNMIDFGPYQLLREPIYKQTFTCGYFDENNILIEEVTSNYLPLDKLAPILYDHAEQKKHLWELDFSLTK